MLSVLFMSKFIHPLIVALCLSSLVNAQKGKNQVNMAVEAAVPVFQNVGGIGGFIKGMYGIGRSAQLSLMIGVAGFKEKNSIDHSTTNTRLIPVLAGYKQSLHKFYLEPQAGYGELAGKITTDDFARPSVGAFFWALGGGYDHKRINAGIRFQQAHGSESTSAGIWQGKDFHYTGIYFGYRIF